MSSARFCGELLEPRCLLAASHLLGTYSGTPLRLTPVGDDLYFTINGSGDLNDIRQFYHHDANGVDHPIIAATGHTLNLRDGMYITAAGSHVFFFSNDGTHRQLWAIDPSRNRAQPLLSGGAVADDSPEPVAYKGRLYFKARDRVGGTELWRSDGTIAGTARVRDLLPGTASSSPSYLTVSGSVLYFTAATAKDGRQLFRSDGTTKGTALVRDLGNGTIAPDAGALIENVAASSDGRLFFTAAQNGGSVRLWVTDGTSDGTVAVPGGYDSFPIEDLTPVGSRLYFTASNAKFGREVWVTDGTAGGTKRVTDLAHGSANGVTYFGTGLFVAMNDSLVFSTYDDNPDPVCGCFGDVPTPTHAAANVWKIGADGTVTKLHSGVASNLAVFRRRIYFQGDTSMWTTDGTSQSTHSFGASQGHDPVAGANALYYVADQRIFELS